MTIEPILIGYHFSKTGGTSLLRHARKNLKPDQYYTQGPHNDRKRRDAGEPLLVDLPPEDRDKIIYLTGHGVTKEHIAMFSHRPICVFTVVRDPFTRFKSVYKHRLRTLPEERHPTPRQLFEEQTPNPFSEALIQRFGGTDIMETLKNFDMILATEQLDDTSSELFAKIGLPGTAERARVYPEEPDLGDVSADEVYERDPLDRAVHQMVLENWRFRLR